jgi:WD40 repeat protein
MSDQSPLAVCPRCGSAEIHPRKSRGDWLCAECLHTWAEDDAHEQPAQTTTEPKARIFLSYGRRDACELADRLEQDLTLYGYSVWRDKKSIVSGRDFMREIEEGLRSTQLVVALLSPHSVRRSGDANSSDDVDSVCLDELHLARFSCKLPIVPVLTAPCEPPLVIYRLDYVELLQWRDFGAQYQAGFLRLLEAIEAALRGEVRCRTWDDRMRPWDFAAFLHEKRRDFCGREWLFRQIDDWRTHRSERALLITGDPGVGKSAIVAQIVHQDPRVLAYHCCQADTPETLRPDRFVRSLAAQIASRVPAYASALALTAVEEALNLDPVSAFERGILTPLEGISHPADDLRYVLIDALDEALAHPESLNIVTVLASRLSRLPGWLRLVATTRKEEGVLRRGELGGLRAWEISPEDNRNLDDIERYIAHRLGQPELASRLLLSLHSSLAGEGQGEGVETAAAGIDHAGEIIRRLREKSAGNFLWVQQALLGIERDQYRFDRLDALPPGLNGLYLDFFQRRFPDAASYEAPKRVLQVVVAAAEPLSEAVLARATGLDPEVALPATLRSLSAFLQSRDGRFVLYHKSLADWLTDVGNRGTRHYTSPKCGHERLADWCWDEYRPGPERMPPYTLKHLPTHLIEAARWNDLAAVLLDLPYLEARAEAGQIFDLALDFTRAGERLPADHPARHHLKLIEQSLRSDLHFISRHPTALFQCLWNRCWWYDCPEAAAHCEAPQAGWPSSGLPWSRPAEDRLATLLESWRAEKERRAPGFRWLRSLRPPPFPLGGAELACFRGHTEGVNSVAVAPDGRRIVSGSHDRTVRVWDAQSGVELACLSGHTSSVLSVAFAPDGRRIVSGSHDQTVRVWDARSGAEMSCLRGHTSIVSSVAYSPDGRYIVSGSCDDTVRVWDIQSGAELACLRGFREKCFREKVGSDENYPSFEEVSVTGDPDRVNCVAFSPDGGRIVSGDNDRTVRVWDATKGVELACLRGHTDAVLSVGFAPDGRRIVSGSFDKTVRIWDAQSGAELACLRGHTNWVFSVAFSPDGRRIVSGAADKAIRVWPVDGGDGCSCLLGHEHGETPSYVGGLVSCARFSPAGDYIVSGGSDRTIRV